MTKETPLGRVMLVDDEPFDQMLYRRIIGRSGLAKEIIGFTRATEAVAYLEDEAQPLVDLILLDIRMPVMNGFEFIEAAQNYLGTEHEVPVVMMLTTSLSPEDHARAETTQSIRGFMNKPLTEEHLAGFVQILDACA